MSLINSEYFKTQILGEACCDNDADKDNCDAKEVQKKVEDEREEEMKESVEEEADPVDQLCQENAEVVAESIDRMNFYQDLYEFCAENNIELTDSAREELIESGIFEEEPELDYSNYNEAVSFFVENGTKLSKEQIEALKEALVTEKASEEDVSKDEKKAKKELAKNLTKTCKDYYKKFGFKFAANNDSKGFINGVTNVIIVHLRKTNAAAIVYGALTGDIIGAAGIAYANKSHQQNAKAKANIMAAENSGFENGLLNELKKASGDKWSVESITIHQTAGENISIVIRVKEEG